MNRFHQDVEASNTPGRAEPAQVDVRPADSAVPKEGPFAILEAATLAGAVGGAAIGAIAGPPGAIVGGVIGTAVGMMAGSTLDIATKRAEAHDRDLDVAIGVTRGDLGAHEAAAAGLGREASETSGLEPTMTTAAARLRDEHARLEEEFTALLSAYRGGDWDDVRARWRPFEVALLAHMALEEQSLFESFRAIDDAEARELLAEHEQLRRALETLGINIELRAVPSADAEELVARLRAHGEREERLFYPWLETSRGSATGGAITPET